MSSATAMRGISGPSELLVGRTRGRNNLILGITGNIANRPDTFDEHRLWIVESGGAMQAAARRAVALRLDDYPGTGIWVCDVDGHMRAMSGYGGATNNGIRIGPVYTPPEHRGDGYTTALVAEQSQWLIDRGRRSCFLYTDLSNPTSNAIYERIGYRQVAESAEYYFRDPRRA